MDDDDIGFSFDFEANLEPAPAPLVSNFNHNGRQDTPPGLYQNMDVPLGPGAGTFKGAVGLKRNYRQTVCRHWLRGLCMKGENCGFLHQFDRSRMPVCRFFAKFGECREPDCVFKHTLEDIKECKMYKLGFCPNGPDCKYRHDKKPGPPPSVQEALEAYLQLQRQHNYLNGNYNYYQRSNPRYQNNSFEPNDHKVMQLKQQMRPPPQQSAVSEGRSVLPAQSAPPAPPPFASVANPMPSGTARYFIIKSNSADNLELSVQHGVWATHKNNEMKLNEAYDEADNVILIFSVNESRHFQGCARMESKGSALIPGPWKQAAGAAHYGHNFRLRWLKLCELSFNKTRHLRNAYNDNLPVKVARDGQELEPEAGEALASLLYNEPDSDLMALAKAQQERPVPDLPSLTHNPVHNRLDNDEPTRPWGNPPGAGNIWGSANQGSYYRNNRGANWEYPRGGQERWLGAGAPFPGYHRTGMPYPMRTGMPAGNPWMAKRPDVAAPYPMGPYGARNIWQRDEGDSSGAENHSPAKYNVQTVGDEDEEMADGYLGRVNDRDEGQWAAIALAGGED